MKENNKLFFNKKVYILFFIFILFFVFKNNSFSQTGQNLSAQININWQAIDSYVPTFYEGRNLPGEQAYIKAIAEVKISTIAGELDPTKLFYAWEYNDKYIYDYSNTNGNIIYFTLDEFRDVNTLKLSIYTNNRQENLLAEKIIKIKPQPSLLLLYKRDSNPIITYSNVVNKKYETYNVGSDNIFDILAEPLYFSIKTPRDLNIYYEWGINGVVGTNNSTNIFNYSVSENSGAGITLKISNQNRDRNLQEGETFINFNLNKTKKTGVK